MKLSMDGLNQTDLILKDELHVLVCRFLLWEFPASMLQHGEEEFLNLTDVVGLALGCEDTNH